VLNSRNTGNQRNTVCQFFFLDGYPVVHCSSFRRPVAWLSAQALIMHLSVCSHYCWPLYIYWEKRHWPEPIPRNLTWRLKLLALRSFRGLVLVISWDRLLDKTKNWLYRIQELRAIMVISTSLWTHVKAMPLAGDSFGHLVIASGLLRFLFLTLSVPKIGFDWLYSPFST